MLGNDDLRKQRSLALCVSVVAACTLAYGFYVGDVNDREADLLIHSDPRLASPAQGLESSNSSRFAAALKHAHDSLKIELTPVSARFFALCCLMTTLAALFAHVTRAIGATAGIVAIVVMIGSAPAALLSHRAVVDNAATLAVTVAVLTCCSATRRLRRSGAYHRIQSACCLTIGLVSSAAAVWIVSDFVTAAHIAERLTSPLWALTAALPWTGLVIIACHREIWNQTEFRHTVASGYVLLLLGLIVAVLAPQVWLGCAHIEICGCAILIGVCWSHWVYGAPTAGWMRAQQAIVYTFACGIPLAAAVGATIRIGIVYNYMERFQALVVGGLAALVVALVLIRKQDKGLLWLPTLAVAVIAKLVYIHAIVPESDHWTSPKAYARAVAKHVPPNGLVATSGNVTPAYRYYLGAPILPLDRLWSAADLSSTIIVVDEALPGRRLDSVPAGAKFIRVLEGPGGRPLQLYRIARQPYGVREQSQPADTFSDSRAAGRITEPRS
jgi:hypothetical protein